MPNEQLLKTADDISELLHIANDTAEDFVRKIALENARQMFHQICTDRPPFTFADAEGLEFEIALEKIRSRFRRLGVYLSDSAD